MRGSGALLIAVLVSGCGLATRSVVRSSIDEETQRENWEKLRAPARELAGDITTAVLDAGASSRLATGLDASVDRFVRTIVHAAADGLGTDVSPALAATVRKTVDQAVEAIVSDGAKRGVSEITDTLTAAAMVGLARGIRDQLGPAFATALEANLGPAMQRVLENNLGPALARTLQTDLGPAFARTLQTDLGPALAKTLEHDLTPVLEKAALRTATAAGEGFVEGVDHRAGPIVQRELDRLDKLLGKADHDLYAIALVAVLALIAGGLGLALWRHLRVAGTHHEALQLVTSQIRRMSGDPAVRELARQITHAGKGRKAGALLDEHLTVPPADPS